MGVKLSEADTSTITDLLEDQVEQFVEDCMQDWQMAAEASIINLTDPGDNSGTYWFIAAAGDMLWAVTVFFPAGPEVAFAWKAATGTAAMLGAAASTNVAGEMKLLDHGWTFGAAKLRLSKQVARWRGEVTKIYVAAIAEWVRGELLYRVLEMAGKSSGPSPSVAQIVTHIHNATAKNERRDFTSNRFVFANTDIDGEATNRSANLRLYMQDQLQQGMNDFYSQWEEFRNGGTGQGAGAPPVTEFEPEVTFPGVPPLAMRRIRDNQYHVKFVNNPALRNRYRP